ncbi:hypothetical protein DXG03_004468 [Asterophora parasitica]|uniref:Ammonium transporter AmtB-like domain-containing protein n=1 Tax=Asterophora parasitica TaxID=117018 RepID=A0A9P7GEV9_9AGAR|nr:hypothetical protein DXG03_004468 [Asterophora parasitica]
MKVLGGPSPGTPLIPELIYSFFQMEFACVTAAILMGGIAERGRVLPAMVFIFLWMTIVYCPLAHWVWGINGWAFKWGVLDFAGKSRGTPIKRHTFTVAGLLKLEAASVASLIPGFSDVVKRASSSTSGRTMSRWSDLVVSSLISLFLRSSMLNELLASLLWFGWLGFNGGSAFGANLRAVVAIWNTMIAAAFGGVVWCLLDFRIERRWTMVGFCSGTIAGLVAATPSSGYLHFWSSVVVGVLSGAILKFLIRVDDALDLFAEHAVGGVVGLLLNAFFASSDIIALDDVSIDQKGGFLDHNWKQLYIQFAYICATCGYTFVVTAFLAKCVDLIPGLHLRNTPEAEKRGMDEIEIGEFASDYIEIRRDFTDGAAPFDSTEGKREFFQPHPVTAGDRHGHAEVSFQTTHHPHHFQTSHHPHHEDHHDDSEPSHHLETMSEKTENSTVAPSSS